MKRIACLTLMLALVFGGSALAKKGKKKNRGGSQEAASDMTVSRIGEPSCDFRMTTNHFTLADGESSIPIVLAFSAPGCQESIDALLFFGYVTTNVSSTQFTAASKVRMTVKNNDTATIANSGGDVPDSGAGWAMISPTRVFHDALIAEPIPSSATMFVTNESGGVIKVRLRAHAYLE